MAEQQPTTTLKLINADELGAFGPAKYSKNVKTTTMPGSVRKEVSELNKMAKLADGKIDSAKKDRADAILKAHTFTVNLDFTKCSLKQILDVASNPQSLMVSLQNGLIRDLGSERIRKIVDGEDGEITYAEGKSFKHSKGVLYVTVRSWLNRPKTTNAKSTEEKMSDNAVKMSDAEFDAWVEAERKRRSS